MSFKTKETRDNVLYIYPSNLSRPLTSFGHPSLFYDINDIAYEGLRSSINIVVASNGDVYAASQFYDGKLCKFSPGKKWQPDIYKANENSFKKFRIVSDQNKIKESAPNSMTYLETKSMKQIKIIARTISGGLFVYKNKYVVNFICKLSNTNKINGAGTDFGVEIYNFDGQCLGYHSIFNENMNTVDIGTKVLCLDNEGCFYFLDYDLGTHLNIIKKYKLDIFEY